MSKGRARISLPRRLWDVAYLWLGSALAAATAWPIYSTPRVIVIAAIATAVGIALVLVGDRLRWQFWRVTLLVFAAYVVLVVPLAIPSALGAPDRILRGVRDGIVGLVVGWKQLLTLTLPLGEYQAVLVPFFAVMLFGSFAAAALIAQKRFSAFAVVVVAAMSAFGLVFGSSDAGAPLAFGQYLLPAPREVILLTGLVVISLVWLVARSRLARAESLRLARARTEGVRLVPQSFWRAARRHILAVLLVVVALVGGIAIAPVAAGISTRHALRDAVDPLLVVRDQPSPLASYRSWFTSKAFDTEIFAVSGDVSKFDRIRLATLDRYDGDRFEIADSSRFSRLPQTAQSAGSVQLTVTIGKGFSGVWVPVPSNLSAAPTFTGARAETLTDGFYVGEADASAIDVLKAADGKYGLRTGDSYSLYAKPDGGGASLSGAQGGAPRVDASTYPALADWVVLQGQPRTGDGLADLIRRLRERGYLSHSLMESDDSKNWIGELSSRAPYSFQPSYAGHSTARIEALFTTLIDQQKRAGEKASDKILVAGVGDDEQFATAAALLARYLGFDSRVVIGARLAGVPADAAVRACQGGVCKGANITAWAEVRSPEGIWVAFDSSPQFAEKPTTIAVGEKLPENPTVPQQSTTKVVDPPPAQRDDAGGAKLDPQAAAGWLETVLVVLRTVGLSTLALTLLLLPVAVLFFMKTFRRRQRRNSPVPEVSVVGAWDELIDSYVDHGIDVDKAHTRQQVATEIGRPAVIALATTLDRAVFAENPPGRNVSDDAWEMVTDERRELSRLSSMPERVRAALSPASFLRYFDRGVVLRSVGMLRRRTP